MLISIQVPKDGEMLIKKTHSINFTTPLVKASRKEHKRIPLSSILGIPHNKIFDSLKKFVGDEVKVGEVIAEKQSLFLAKKYYSEYDGTIKELNHEDGSLLIEVSTDDKTEINSTIKGIVEEINKKEIMVKVKNGKEYDLKEASESFGGESFYCTGVDCQLISEDKVHGKVIIAEKLMPYDQVKLETLGARGFVTLHTLPEKSSTPWAKINKVADFEKMTDTFAPYCTIDIDKSTIYFYS